jgi:O-antigen ligase
VSFALLILAKDFTNGSIKEDLFKGPKIFLFAYFLLISILLAVRIQLIALPFAMLILIVLQHKKRVAGKLNLKPIILGIVGFSIIVLVLPDTRRRIVESYHEIRSFNKVIDNKQTNHRVYIWKSAVKVIGENFWFGTGSGDADDELAKHLDVIDAKFWNGKEVYYLKSGTYNYHNQYLQWWASNGVIGIAALLIILFGGVTQSYKRGDFLTVVMLVLVALSFMTESMLERQAGVLFFTFFFGLLVINQAQSKSQV